MTTLPFKQHIADLADLLKQTGVRNAVICPGSRNAPIIQVFQREKDFNCHSIVDERSAGYVALGMAIETGRPVVVITTSGTAVLNLAPAVAEAYNQQIPLIVLTGDRPQEYPPQFTNQRINQSNVFGPNANGFYEFPPEFENSAHLDKVMHDAAGVIRQGCIETRRPVHLNLVLREPLYEEIPQQVMTRPDIPGIRTGKPTLRSAGFNTSESALLKEHLAAQKKILILAGMANYNAENRKTLEELTAGFQVAVIAENIANLHGKNIISAPELVLAGASKEEIHDLTPDLVVAMGGPIVSKRTRLFVQKLGETPLVLLKGAPGRALPGIEKLLAESKEGADLARSGTHKDLLATDELQKERRTEQPASKSKHAWTDSEHPGLQKERLQNKEQHSRNDKQSSMTENRYGKIWGKLEKDTASKARSFLLQASFSNITAMGKIMEKIPANTMVHLGNSGVIRYAQLLPARTDLRYQSNRGTSGIDGSLSTAVGAAMVSEKMHLAIIGDLSFVYDSNALWNRNFPSNLKIIILNDQGGGIFRLLDGPDRMPFFEEFSVTRHPVTIKHIVKAFGMNILPSNSDYTLDECLDTLFKKGAEATVLEVDTSTSENSGIFKQFFNAIQP